MRQRSPFALLLACLLLTAASGLALLKTTSPATAQPSAPATARPAAAGEANTPQGAPPAEKPLMLDREGEDWPKFLGPRETGVSGETGIVADWGEDGLPVLWKKRVGTGYSAPSVRGERLVLHHRLADREIVECMNAASGETLWKYDYPSQFSDPYGYNNGPRCSPLLTADRCFVYGAEGMLVCLSLDEGKKIWSRDIKTDFNIYKPGGKTPNWFFGIGCTPVLEGNLLITLVGGRPNSAVVAFDANTGEIVWQSCGKETWDGVKTDDPFQPTYQWSDDKMLISYASPLVATIHGKRHVLCLLRQGLVSLNPQDGSLNFKYWFMSRTYESVNAARPVVIGDKIFLSAAYEVGSALLQVADDGKSVKELWRDRDNMQTHWSTAIHVDGYIYGFSGRHEQGSMFRCIDVKDGSVVWETTGFEGELDQFGYNPQTGQLVNRTTGKAVPWPFYGRGSKILVEDRFIVLGERGTLAIVKVNPRKFEEICRTSYREIQAPSWTAPVLSRKRLYLRSEDFLLCLDAAAKPKDAAKE